jgi:hypothetical protein
MVKVSMADCDRTRRRVNLPGEFDEMNVNTHLEADGRLDSIIAALADTPPSAEDVATLDACRAYQTAFRLGAAWDRGEIPDAVGEAAHSRQFEEMDQLSAITARSPTAILAKAHAAYLALSTMTDGAGEMETEIRLAFSALADVLGSVEK